MNEMTEIKGGAGARDTFELRQSRIELPEAIAIGASTGGPQALLKVLSDIKAVQQPVFITQHMPITFIDMLSEHIHRETGMPCSVAQDGQEVKNAHVYLAPGDHHMMVARGGALKTICLSQDAPENFCRPSVDPMLRSLADTYGKNLLILILTGMGNDGGKGGAYAVEKGAAIIAQDEASSVVWGMPKVVARAGLCHAVLPLNEIGPYAFAVAQKGRK
jgi:two-component system chemotaxis response regulator CheB